MKKYILIITAIYFYLSEIASAAPVVSSVSGSLYNGSEVIIFGSEFGIKSEAAPFAWSDMESNTLAAQGVNWTSYGWPSGIMEVSSLNQRHGRSLYNAYCSVPGNGNEYCAFRQERASSNTWFVQYWFYTGSNWDWEDGNIKILRLWNSASSNLRVQGPINDVDVVVETSDQGHGGYGSNCSSGGWVPVVSGFNTVDQVFGYPCGGETLPGSIGWHNYETDIKDGRWHLFQWEYMSGLGDGLLRWWVDGRLVFDHADINTGNDSKHPFIIGWYMSNSSDGCGDLFFDDVYIDNIFSRIEIGNASTYGSCTVREIQIPSAWSQSSVTVTANQGSFNNGDTAYLYVVDSAGSVNATGFPVTIGSGGGDTTAPQSPGGLSVR